MASINLLKQFRARQNSANSSDTSQEKGGLGKSISARLSGFTLGGSGGSALDRGEKFRMTLMIVGVASIFVSRSMLSQTLAIRAAEKQAEITDIDNQIKVESKKLESFKGIKAEIDSYEAKMNDLRDKLELIKSVRRNRNTVVRMIDFVVTQMPSNIWLTKMNVDFTEGVGKQITVFGYSSTMQTVSEFMKHLEGAVFFPSWKLVSTESDSITTGAKTSSSGSSASTSLDAKKFEISAGIVVQ